MEHPDSGLDAIARNGLRGLAVLLLAVVPAVTGCKGFFVPTCQENNNCPTSSTTGTGTGTGSTPTGSSSAVRSPAQSQAQPEIFVADARAEKIQGYSIADGRVIAVGTPLYTSGQTTIAIATNAAHHLLAQATRQGSIFLESIAAHGFLQSVNQGHPIAQVRNPQAISFAPSGNLMLIASADPAKLQIDRLEGSAASVKVATATTVPLTSGESRQVLVTSNSRAVFIALGSGGVDGFSINPQTGQIEIHTHITPLRDSSEDVALASSSDSKLLFVAEKGAGIRVFAAQPDGTFLEVAGSPFGDQLGDPSALMVNPTHNEIYAAYPKAKYIAGYRFGPSAELILASTTPFDPAASPTALSVGRDGNYLTALSAGGSLHLFELRSDGTIVQRTPAATNTSSASASAAHAQ